MKNPSLKNLFFSEKDKGGALEGASLGDLESDIKEQLPKVSLGAVQEEMSAKIGEVLDVGLGDVMAAAWEKVGALREYADPDEHPPEETVLLPLAAHTIESEHEPSVELKIKDMVICTIQLEVALELALEGVVLKVQGGKIREIQAGSCQASGSLACSLETKLGTREVLNLEKETPQFQLRGAIPLGAGIEIPGSGESVES